MKHLGLFEGIGGFSLAARWMGWKTIAWCEIDQFCQKVLRHHFPESIGHSDIKQTDFTPYANTIDILTGGFPCQPYSAAGKRKGKDDERHLWPEMLRAIREISPRWVVGENVRGLTNWNGGVVFDEVQADLETEGYEITPFLLPACAVNAPHRRDRIWFIAHSISNGYSNEFRESGQQEKKKQGTEQREEWDEANREWNGCNIERINDEEYSSNAKQQRLEREDGFKLERTKQSSKHTFTNPNGNKRPERGLHQKESKEAERYFSPCDALNYQCKTWDNFPIKPPICGRDDGISRKLDAITFPRWRKESLKAYGNAIVPQVVFQIFKAIQEYENQFYHI